MSVWCYCPWLNVKNCWNWICYYANVDRWAFSHYTRTEYFPHGAITMEKTERFKLKGIILLLSYLRIFCESYSKAKSFGPWIAISVAYEEVQLLADPPKSRPFPIVNTSQHRTCVLTSRFLTHNLKIKLAHRPPPSPFSCTWNNSNNWSTPSFNNQ